MFGYTFVSVRLGCFCVVFFLRQSVCACECSNKTQPCLGHAGALRVPICLFSGLVVSFKLFVQIDEGSSFALICTLAIFNQSIAGENFHVMALPSHVGRYCLPVRQNG